jgi:hypothetical protein
MRTRAALLLTAFAILVVAASVIVSSHFGTRDWPTPPLPDTATRLITPTEAAGRISDRSAGDDHGSARRIAAAGTPRAGRAERSSRGAQRRKAPDTRRGTARTGDRGGRRGSAHAPAVVTTPPASTEGPDDSQTPAVPTAPATTPAPAAPVVEAGSGDSTQARPQDPASSLPAVPAVPVAPDPTPVPAPAPSGHGDGGGHGHGRGPLHALLEVLP